MQLFKHFNTAVVSAMGQSSSSHSGNLCKGGKGKISVPAKGALSGLQGPTLKLREKDPTGNSVLSMHCCKKNANCSEPLWSQSLAASAAVADLAACAV